MDQVFGDNTSGAELFRREEIENALLDAEQEGM